jgi:hypothetical protein
MSFKISTGLRDHLLITGSLKAALDGKVIRIYSGPEPASADAALSGNTLLCIISNDGDGSGLNMADTSSGGVLAKDASETWIGEIIANGTATFYRMSGLADAGGLSTTEVRIQGTIANAGEELNFSNVVFVDNDDNTKSINSFYIAMPTA